MSSEHLSCCSWGPRESSVSSTTSRMKEFEVLKTLWKGRYSRILLVQKRKGTTSVNEKMVLKAFQYDEIQTMDRFQRELSTNYTLSPHPNIVTSFNVSFTWEGSLIYAQEFAPFGDLRKHIKKTKGLSNGLKDEGQVKGILRQIASALEFMHLSFQIVHGCVKPENILVFHADFAQVKLCDFGWSENVGNHVTRPDYEDEAYISPEMINTHPGEKYSVSMASDAWQLGILLFYCVRGKAPWGIADLADSNYCKYVDWLRHKSLRLPDAFSCFSPRALRLLKRLLEPKPSKRYEVKEVFKYLKDDWLQKPPRKLLRRQSDFDSEGSESSFAGGSRSRSISSSPFISSSRRSSTTSNSMSGNQSWSSDSSATEQIPILKMRKPFGEIAVKSLKTVKFNISADLAENSNETQEIIEEK